MHTGMEWNERSEWNGMEACIWIFIFEKMETEFCSTLSLSFIINYFYLLRS